MQTGDYKFVKNLNERLVLNLIRRHEVISSSDLVRITGMRPSTIFNILKDFTEKDFVNNLGKGQSTDKGGKKPYLWSLKSTAAYSVGVEVDLNRISAVILDFTNGIVLQENWELDVYGESKKICSLLREKIETVITKSEIPIGKFLGIGIAVPGIVDCKGEVILMSEALSQTNIEVSKELEEYFDLPVLVRNDANTTAIGEKIAGSAKESKHLISALIKSTETNNGMGIGVLINEELHLGAAGAAGEINFSLPYFSEILNSIKSVIKKSEYIEKNVCERNKITIRLLTEAAKENDIAAVKFFERLGYFIGKGLARPVALVNPDTLVLVGDLTEVGEILKDAIHKVLDMEIHNISCSSIKIITSKFGDKAVAIGAAAIILNEYFKVPNLENNKLQEG
ncbi:MAG: ROK family protein [Rhodothermaceae bacterium]